MPTGRPHSEELSKEGRGIKQCTVPSQPDTTPIVTVKPVVASSAAQELANPRGQHQHRQAKKGGIREMNIAGRLYLQDSIGVKVTCLIDTGATTSFISWKIFEELAEGDSNWLEDEQGKTYTAGAIELPTMGRIELTLEIGGAELAHNFIVAHIEENVILGMDFLRQNKVQWNWEEGTLDVGDEKVPWETSEGRWGACRVVVDETTTIPAQHEAIIPGRLIHPERTAPTGVLLLRKAFLYEHQLCLASAIVSKKHATLPIRVMNPHDEPIVVPKGVDIAIYSPVKEVVGTLKEEEGGDLFDPAYLRRMLAGERESRTLPRELQELWERSTPELDERQGQQVKQLLLDFQDVFAVEGQPLAKTNLVTHQIDTGTAKPIWIPPRRMPIHQA